MSNSLSKLEAFDQSPLGVPGRPLTEPIAPPDKDKKGERQPQSQPTKTREVPRAPAYTPSVPLPERKREMAEPAPPSPAGPEPPPLPKPPAPKSPRPQEPAAETAAELPPLPAGNGKLRPPHRRANRRPDRCPNPVERNNLHHRLLKRNAVAGNWRPSKTQPTCRTA